MDKYNIVNNLKTQLAELDNVLACLEGISKNIKGDPMDRVRADRAKKQVLSIKNEITNIYGDLSLTTEDELSR